MSSVLPYDTFVFSHRAIAGATVRLGYRLHGMEGSLDFEETFQLPAALAGSAADPADIAAALDGLHLAAGVSYWKTCCPSRIEIATHTLARRDTAFWDEVYNRGLGELYYRNGLDPRGLARFPARTDGGGEAEGNRAEGTAAAGPALVLAGGGKDSVVAYEVLRAAGLPQVPLQVVPAGREWRLAPDLEGTGLRVTRRLDPRLLELNAAGAYNGHVPFSAILAFTAQLVAVLGGFGAVVAANERSASNGNLLVDGVEVNHQWSKGLRFEEMFQDWQRAHLRRVPLYFSLLRPLSELRITRALATHRRWLGSVTSCNANFKQSPAPPAQRWCGRCAKCVFVAMMLAPWLEESELQAVFATSEECRDRRQAEPRPGNPLAMPGNVPEAERLLGLRDHKPFDCVGTPREAAAALWLCHSRGLGKDWPVMRMFRERVLPGLSAPADLVSAEMAIGADHLLPARWEHALANYLEHH